jgi:hypothetical protein
LIAFAFGSVPDPNPDPHVFRPPGSGSGSIPLTSGSGSGRPKNMWIRILLSSSKNIIKILDYYCFVTSFGLLSLKNDVNVPSKSNKQKNL